VTDEHAELDRLAQRFPVARGRFEKGVLLRMRAELEQTSKLIEAKPGKRRRPQVATKIDRDLVDHQRKLTAQVDALLLHGMAVDADVAVVAGYLRRTQYVAAHAEDLASRAHGAVEQVADALADLAELVGGMQSRLDHRIDDAERRLARLEARLDRVEAELAADRALERVLSRWRNGITYDGLPWAWTVPLLAYEVFAGPVGNYELVARDGEHYRERLTAELVKAGTPWSARRPAEDVVREAADELGSGAIAVKVGEWLGTGLPADLDGVRGALVAALRDRINATDPVPADGPRLTGAGFAELVVHEQAETVLEQRKKFWPAGREAHGTG
jgi:hypothetical protein